MGRGLPSCFNLTPLCALMNAIMRLSAWTVTFPAIANLPKDLMLSTPFRVVHDLSQAGLDLFTIRVGFKPSEHQSRAIPWPCCQNELRFFFGGGALEVMLLASLL